MHLAGITFCLHEKQITRIRKNNVGVKTPNAVEESQVSQFPRRKGGGTGVESEDTATGGPISDNSSER